MNRQAQAAVLFLVGAAVLHAGLTDLYLRYVKAGLRPLLLAAGVVLIVAALATVWYERRPAKTSKAELHTGHGNGDGDEREDRHEDGDGHGHGHVHREPRVAWLLVLPSSP